MQKKGLKNYKLFSEPSIRTGKNRVKPINIFTEFKREEIQQSIVSRFEQQVSSHRDKLAVKVKDSHLTYGALDEYANGAAQEVIEKCEGISRLDKKEKARYSRQMRLHNWGIESQEKLKSTVVFVAGAGGSGSPLIMQLALLGVGTIIVCDDDHVELSNLNRQVLHDETRLNMNKALSAAQSVKGINPHVKVIAYPQRITRDNVHRLVADSAIIFDNVDDMETKFILSQCAVEKGIPHILSSMIDLDAYVVIFHSPYTPCFHCLYDREVLKEVEEIKKMVKNYQKIPNPVATPPLFLSTGFAVNEALKILLGSEEEKSAYNKYFFFHQQGLKQIAGSDGYRLITYYFNPHFKEISRQQGFDWEKGWDGDFLDEIEIKPNPVCPLCGPGRGKELTPLEPGPIISGPTIKNDFQQKKRWGVPSTSRLAALLFGHDADMIVGIMAALKAGKIYVPLDPGSPLERLKYMMEDSGAGMIITNDQNRELAVRLREQVDEHLPIIDISRVRKQKGKNQGNPGVYPQPNDVAYILYTSGSTGRPKGVIQDHRNVLHFARVYANALHINSSDRLTLFSSYSFDAAKMDIYGALLNGGTLYPYDIKKEDNLSGLPRWLQEEGITIYHSIPTVYRYFIDLLGGEEKFAALRLVVLGGEAVFKKDAEAYKRYFPDHCLLINGLGPTESTVTVQYFMDKEMEITRDAVPVGYAVEDTEVFLIDEKGKEVHGYGEGEMVFQSEHLSLGYLNAPQKTAEMFGPNPLTRKGRVYWTGDLGRRLIDGAIEYVGRKDFQIKIRGHRVEVGEIETTLLNHKAIKEVVVAAKEDASGNTSLYAYYVTKPLTSKSGEQMPLTITGLKEYLSGELPGYMIPTYFIPLEKLPLTPNGKIDRLALAEMNVHEAARPNEYVIPKTEVEKQIAGLWREVLKLDKVGIHDNFFDLGGHSLNMILLNRKLIQVFNRDIPLVMMLRYPTIGSFVQYLEEGEFVTIARRSDEKRLGTVRLNKIRNRKKEEEINAPGRN